MGHKRDYKISVNKKRILLAGFNSPARCQHSKDGRQMLRFETTPDDVFTAILTKALTEVEFELSDHIDFDDPEDLDVILPVASRVFTAETALKTVRNLFKCHRKPELYSLNGFHYLLIYDILRGFIDWHNDSVRAALHDTTGSEVPLIGGFRVEEIDFPGITDIYFYDLDFLFPEDLMRAIGEKEREAMDIMEVAYLISVGQKPTDKQLELKIESPEIQKIEKSTCFGSNSKVYPDCGIGGE